MLCKLFSYASEALQMDVLTSVTKTMGADRHKFANCILSILLFYLIYEYYFKIYFFFQ